MSKALNGYFNVEMLSDEGKSKKQNCFKCVRRASTLERGTSQVDWRTDFLPKTM